MAVAVKTTAIKASAIEGSEALFFDGIENTAIDVSKNTVTAGSVELPRNEPDAPRSDSNKGLTATRICQQPGTLHKRLIVDVTAVELHQMSPRLSHEDRQRQRSTDGKPDL